jgi:hypothetical protein
VRAGCRRAESPPNLTDLRPSDNYIIGTGRGACPARHENCAVVGLDSVHLHCTRPTGLCFFPHNQHICTLINPPLDYLSCTVCTSAAFRRRRKFPRKRESEYIAMDPWLNNVVNTTKLSGPTVEHSNLNRDSSMQVLLSLRCFRQKFTKQSRRRIIRHFECDRF